MIKTRLLGRSLYKKTHRKIIPVLKKAFVLYKKFLDEINRKDPPNRPEMQHLAERGRIYQLTPDMN